MRSEVSAAFNNPNALQPIMSHFKLENNNYFFQHETLSTWQDSFNEQEQAWLKILFILRRLSSGRSDPTGNRAK